MTINALRKTAALLAVPLTGAFFLAVAPAPAWSNYTGSVLENVLRESKVQFDYTLGSNDSKHSDTGVSVEDVEQTDARTRLVAAGRADWLYLGGELDSDVADQRTAAVNKSESNSVATYYGSGRKDVTEDTAILFLALTTHPLRVLYAAVLVLVVPTVLVPTYLVLRSEGSTRFILGVIDRLSLLASIYLLLDAAGLVLVVIRNL